MRPSRRLTFPFLCVAVFGTQAACAKSDAEKDATLQVDPDFDKKEKAKELAKEQRERDDSLEGAAVSTLVKRGDTSSRDSVLLANTWMLRTHAGLFKTANGLLVHKRANDILLDSMEGELKTKGEVNADLVYNQIEEPTTKEQLERWEKVKEKKHEQQLAEAALHPRASDPTEQLDSCREIIEGSGSIHASCAIIRFAQIQIQSRGYSCSSVSGISESTLGRREISVFCNHDTYHFKVIDYGGKWIVDVQD